MTSFRQFEANRRNARKSTGPLTEMGKQRSRRNAVRHGLTAETVIGSLEGAEGYKLFEATVTADFSPETAVERELVLRLASLLWRLRRATSIETGLFLDPAESIADSDNDPESAPEHLADAVVHIEPINPPAEAKPTSSGSFENRAPLEYTTDDLEHTQNPPGGDPNTISVLARRFLNLAAQDNGAFERLGRYETALWRQVCQTLFMIEVLRRQNLDAKWLPRSAHPGGSRSFSLSALARR